MPSIQKIREENPDTQAEYSDQELVELYASQRGISYAEAARTLGYKQETSVTQQSVSTDPHQAGMAGARIGLYQSGLMFFIVVLVFAAVVAFHAMKKSIARKLKPSEANPASSIIYRQKRQQYEAHAMIDVNSGEQRPYEWQRVIVWALTLFLLGLTTRRLTPGLEADRFEQVIGLFSGVVWAIVGGLIVAIWKYFKRSPSTISPAAIQANDKGLFIAALVLAVYLTGKAIYLETYGALVDATILVGLGFAVKAGIGPARWGFAIYAFISPILVPILVMANGGGSAVIWPFVFYYACRSLGSDVKTTGVGNSAPPTPQSSHSINPTHTPIPTPSNSQSQDSVYQPAARQQQPVMPTQNTSMPSIATHAPAFDEMALPLTQTPQRTTGEIPSMEDTEDRIYAQVGEEIESGNTDKGIWTRAFAQAGGDDKQTRVLYIQSRVAKLLAVESEQNEARLAEQQAEVNEQERLKRVSLQLKMGAIGGDEANGAVSEKLASSFLLAVRNGAIKQVERMIEETPILLAVRNKGGDTCLHIAARENHTGLIKLLAEHGAYANARNDEGKTARDIASSMGFPATAGALGAISASVCPHCYSQIDSIGVTLCPKCYRTIPQLADERRRLFSDLVLAAKEGNLTGITTILEKDRMLVSETDSNGYTALHYAATGKSSEVIKALITAGADIKHTHHFGKTPFEIASADMKPFLA
jgi:hypothetical protein